MSLSSQPVICCYPVLRALPSRYYLLLRSCR
jgi:hypothetical protein